MIDVVLVLNARGDIVLSRQFRNSPSLRTLSEQFRNELISTKRCERSPVNIIGGLCYVHLSLSELYVVTVSSSNVNCLVCMQYCIRLMQLINSYYGNADEAVMKQNIPTLQALMDETMDYGTPLNVDAASLKEYIPPAGIDALVIKSTELSTAAAKKVTGDAPWREDGLVFQVNEVFVDVVEDVNLLVSPQGDILQSEIAGRLVVNNFLSGTPECELALNARAYGEQLIAPAATSVDLPEAGDVTAVGAGGGSGAAPTLNNVSFHPCVRLGRYDAEQSIRFIPPNGEFTLMTFRSPIKVVPPMRIASARVKEVSKTRTEMEFALKCDLTSGQMAVNVEVTVPCPDNTAKVDVKVAKGRAKYRAEVQAIVWTIPQVAAEEEIVLTAEVQQIATTLEAADMVWSRPPISIQFKCVSHSLTGLQVTELKVEEPVFRYNANKWVRYTIQAGKYQCRI